MDQPKTKNIFYVFMRLTLAAVRAGPVFWCRRFLGWLKWWVGYAIAPDYWTYHSPEYHRQKGRNWHRESRRLHRHANKVRNALIRERERRLWLSHEQKLAEAVERARALVLSELDRQRLMSPVEVPAGSVWGWVRQRISRFCAAAQKRWHRAKLARLVWRRGSLRLVRRRWLQFKRFYFWLPRQAARNARSGVTHRHYVGYHVVLSTPAVSKLVEFAEMRQRQKVEDFETWKRAVAMTTQERLALDVYIEQQRVQGEYNRMRLESMLTFEARIKRWFIAPFKAAYQFGYWKIYFPLFIFSWVGGYASRMWYRMIRGWVRETWDWLSFELFARRHYNRVFLSETWVEAGPSSPIAWYKAMRKILFFAFIAVNLAISGLFLFGWSLGGTFVYNGILFNLTWDAFMFWMLLSHTIAPLIDWFLCPGGLWEVATSIYWWFVNLIWLPPDPYEGVYERMLEEREKEQKLRLKEIRRQRIKAGLEHTWWRLAWLYALFSWEYFVGLLWYGWELVGAVFFDLRRKPARLWKNRRAIGVALWSWVSWWAWRSTRPFRRLRTWWSMRKNR